MTFHFDRGVLTDVKGEAGHFTSGSFAPYQAVR
jgi:hypothetical protein